LEIEMDELLFELRGPDGHVWKLYANGTAEGFPVGTVIINNAIPVIDALLSKQIPRACVTNKQS